MNRSLSSIIKFIFCLARYEESEISLYEEDDIEPRLDPPRFVD